MTVNSRHELVQTLKKMPSLFLGIFICSLALLAMLYGGLGMNAWGVFHMGICTHTFLTLGEATQIVGLMLLVVSFFLGEIPGLGSVFNMFFVGKFVDIVDNMQLFFTPETFIGKLVMLCIGIILLGIGTFFYMRVGLGAGPRDGMMVGLVKRFNKPVWMVRGSIESIALVVGYILGGPVGIGTLIVTGTIGFSVQLAFKLGGYNPKAVKHKNLLRLFQDLTGAHQVREQHNKQSCLDKLNSKML